MTFDIPVHLTGQFSPATLLSQIAEVTNARVAGRVLRMRPQSSEFVEVKASGGNSMSGKMLLQAVLRWHLALMLAVRWQLGLRLPIAFHGGLHRVFFH